MDRLVAAFTKTFYEWEVRGRGWWRSDEFLMLEPAFAFLQWPAFDHQQSPTPRDDGHRPTLLGSLRGLLTGSRPAPIQSVALNALDETPSSPVIPSDDDDELHAFDLRVPPSLHSRPDNAAHLLKALGAARAPLAYEVIGHEGQVHFQITCRESDIHHLLSSVEGYYPDIALVPAPDLLWRSWEEDRSSFVVDFGLSEEFFLPIAPIASFAIDPLIPLVSALSLAASGETLCFQILFERARNPWSKAIMDAVGGPDRTGIFEDAPHFLKLAEEKSATPIFAAVLRVAAQAESIAAAKRLASRVEAFVTQFERTHGNHFIPLSNAGYADDLHAAALLLRQTHRTGMLLSAQELVSLIHVPDASLRHATVSREATRTKQAPKGSEAGTLLLGHNHHRGQVSPVSVTTEERLAHVHAIGATGTGKSTFLLNAALADIRARHGVVVLDPHGDLIDDLLAVLPADRVDDVVLFDPMDDLSPIGLNPLSASNDWEREHLAADVVGMFQKLATSWGDSMGSVLSNAVLALVESDAGGTLIDLRHFLLDETERKRVLATVADEEIRFFWEKSFRHIGTRSIGPILTRLDAFLRSKTIRRIVSAPQSTFTWDRVLDGEHIFLGKLSLGLLGEENAGLLGSLIMSQLHQAALRRQRQTRDTRHPAFVYVDEFQHFAVPSLSSLLSEGRKYGVGLVLAHQTLAQIGSAGIETAVMGNAYTRVTFRVSAADAGKLAPGSSYFLPQDFVSLARGEAIVRLGSADRDCSVVTPSPPQSCVPHVADHMEQIRAASRAQFGQTFRTLTRSTAPTPSAPAPQRSATSPSVSLPADMVGETFATQSAPDQFLPVILPKSRHRGEQHRHLSQIVARLGQERGFLATLEAPVSHGRIDVALVRDDIRIACEISVSTEVAHEVGNARKCLAAGYLHVLMISTDDSKRNRLRVATDSPEFAAVKVVSPEELANFLDSLLLPDPVPGQVIRGYKVKINRRSQSPDDGSIARAKIGRALTKPPKPK